MEMSTQTESFMISVVLPCYNEGKSIALMIESLRSVLTQHYERFQIVCVDDGSGDDTAKVVREIATLDSRVHLVRLARNYGKEVALSAGIDYACGDAVVLMDADFQHPPATIVSLVNRWLEGADMVVATRVNRDTDGIVRRLFTRAFYYLFARVSEIRLTEGGGDFRLLDRRAVLCLQALPERSRFMKGLYALIGLEVATVAYNVEARIAGETRFGFTRLWRFALDGMVSFTSLPLRIWSYVGMLLAFPSAIYALVIVYQKVMYGTDTPGYASIATMILLFSGIQLFGLGVFGEYLARVFEESKRRPLYVVSETLGQVHGTFPAAHGGVELPPRVDRRAAVKGDASCAR